MSDKTFRNLLDWFMASDPWPLDEKHHLEIEAFLDSESGIRGFKNWLDAYHLFEKKGKGVRDE